MATDVRKHLAPIGTETPRRQAFNDLSLSICDVVPVANVAARAQLVADLTAAGYTPSATHPLFVYRADGIAGRATEYTVDAGVTWNALPTADWSPKVARKTSTTQVVTNSVVLVDDDNLFMTLPVGLHSIRCELTVNVGDVAGDIKTAWTFGGVLSGSAGRLCAGPGVGAVALNDGTARNTSHGLGTTVTYGTGASGAAIIETMLLQVTTAGKLQLQWAQNVANATATSLGVQSRIIAQRIE